MSLAQLRTTGVYSMNEFIYLYNIKERLCIWSVYIAVFQIKLTSIEYNALKQYTNTNQWVIGQRTLVITLEFISLIIHNNT